MTKPIQIRNIMLGEGIPCICAPLTGKKEEQLLEEARRAVEAGADLVEWRADLFEAFEEEEKMWNILSILNEMLGELPILFTIRTAKEGGGREVSSQTYEHYNLHAAETGMVDLVDVEIFSNREQKQTLVKKLKELGVTVIGSYHDFKKTEDREALKKRFLDLHDSGADILKVAEMPKDFEDTAALMQATKAASLELEEPLIAISMGNTGAISRISGENFGSCLTFGTVGAASAPGQFQARELRMMLEALHEKNKEEK